MIDTELLKEKIIDLAIQGKLTEQLPTDGNARVLFEQIQKEKRRLIKEGKIKKEMPLPKITTDDIPFEIPNNWIWTRWGKLAERIQYGYNAPAKTSGKIKMVRISDIQDGRVQWETVPYCDIEDNLISDYLLHENDILFARTGGTVGKSYLVSDVGDDSVFAGYLIRTSYSSDICASYMKYYMESRLYWRQLQDGTIATAQPNCNGKTLSKMIVPLPPYQEQIRIANKIESIFYQIDIIDSLQKQYASNLEVLRGKIIDAGISGKLTEQLSEDGNADDLYAQIQEEKATLIKGGKIKKEKPLPEITDDEIPFEIPDNWMWVRVGSIFNVGTGMTPIKSESRFYVNGKIPWVNSALTSNRYIDKVDTLITDYALENTSLRLYPEHTLIVAMYGEGKTRGQISELLIPATINQACAALASYKYREEMTRYVYYCFLFNYKRIREKAGGTSQPNLSVQKIKETIIPLPPLCEQKRIVEVIERIHKII